MSNGTKLCKYCQSEISSKAKVCPNCKRKQGGALKWVIIAVVVVIFFAAIGGGDSEPSNEGKKIAVTDSTKNMMEEKDAASTEMEEPEAEETEIKTVEDSGNDISLGKVNALGKAEQYLMISGFSYTGLMKQLEFEGFTTEEAKYAVDNCGADWNEQAAKKAKEYLNISAFSKDGLINQLTFEGFTQEEAEYAATAVGY